MAVVQRESARKNSLPPRVGRVGQASGSSDPVSRRSLPTVPWPHSRYHSLSPLAAFSARTGIGIGGVSFFSAGPSSPCLEAGRRQSVQTATHSSFLRLSSEFLSRILIGGRGSAWVVLVGSLAPKPLPQAPTDAHVRLQAHWRRFRPPVLTLRYPRLMHQRLPWEHLVERVYPYAGAFFAPELDVLQWRKLPPSPQAVLGPFYLGVQLGTLLYGILVLQAITYYQNYKRDKLWLRLFVLYLFVAETASTGLSVAMIYEPLVAQFGTDKPMRLFPSLLPSQPFLEAAVFVPVQFFYAWRISVIQRSYIAPVLICLTSIASAVGAVWTGIIVHEVKEYARKPAVNNTALIWSVSAAGADIMITACLMWSLRNRRTGIKRTDDAINSIVRNSVQTGFITVVFTLLDVVLFVALSHSTLNFVFDFGLPKLYSNALISTLNARSGGAGRSARSECPVLRIKLATGCYLAYANAIGPQGCHRDEYCGREGG
ncbi:MFS domain-containing protein [Mycena venus]|uniref:MFS domain-containing protein n=1 Tax=Mycena venus TaxID=2733690 RepID=A0A8H7CHI1_9AGAR|nr:MFS domain-containing protein [Mycena venus]